MNLYIAPIQGHTDAAWRHFHNELYGNDGKYFTPFMRAEHGELRPKDLKDFTNPLNSGVNLEPQVIFKDMQELELLINALEKAGASTINLNMGCPFPLQTGKGRGAGFLRNIDEASKLAEVLEKFPTISFSVKMRLGYDNPTQWQGIIDILNETEFNNIYVHPRIARQQYGGQLDLEQFEQILKRSKNPVVFNGDICTPEHAAFISSRFPEISGIMLGRGLLGRPSLGLEIASRNEWAKEERLKKMLDFHRQLFKYYSESLCGDAQILSKIKPFWEYSESEIGRKAWKAIKKASNLSKYNTALASIEY